MLCGKVPGKKIHQKRAAKKVPCKKNLHIKGLLGIPWIKVPFTKVPKNTFSIKEMPGKSTEGNWTILFLFLLIIPSHDSVPIKRCSTLTSRSHVHRTLGNAHPGTVFSGTFFARIFYIHAKNGIWIIHGGTRKITVCSSTFHEVATKITVHTVKCTGTYCNFSSATMNYPNTVLCVNVMFQKFWTFVWTKMIWKNLLFLEFFF